MMRTGKSQTSWFSSKHDKHPTPQTLLHLHNSYKIQNILFIKMIKKKVEILLKMKDSDA